MGIVSKNPLLKSLKSSIQFFHPLRFQNRKDFQLTNPGDTYFNSLGLAGRLYATCSVRMTSFEVCFAPGIWF